MRAHLIAVGERMPAWVQQGFAEYAKRLSRELPLDLVEVCAGGMAFFGQQRVVVAEAHDQRAGRKPLGGQMGLQLGDDVRHAPDVADGRRAEVGQAPALLVLGEVRMWIDESRQERFPAEIHHPGL